MALNLITSFVGLLLPFTISKLVDALTNLDQSAVFLAIAMIVLVAVGFFLNWIQNYFWFKMIHLGTTKFRTFVFGRLLLRDAYFFQEHPIGDLVNRVLNDTEQYARKKIVRAPILILNISTLLIMFLFLAYMNIRLSIVVVISGILYGVSYQFLNQKLRESATRERESFSHVMSEAEETLTGIYTVRIFRKEHYFTNRFLDGVNEHYRFMTKLQVWKSLGNSLTTALIQLIPVLTLLAGALMLLSHETTLGVVMGFYAYLPYLWEPIENLTNLNLDSQQARAVEKRIESLIVEEIHVLPESAPDAKPSSDGFYSLAVKNVTAFYGSEAPLFQNLSFIMEQGDRLAITGASGVGKSSLIQLLLGESEPKHGNIMINGVQLSPQNKSTLLSFISVVPQNIFLFRGTFEENICFDIAYSEEKYHQILHTTFLEEKEGSLKVDSFSGGERQRVGLARALIKGSGLLIMDEPTAALDMLTEKKFISNLDTYLKENNASLIVVSHRPEILRICNMTLDLLGNGEWNLSKT